MRKSLLKRVIPAVMVAVLAAGSVSTGASAASAKHSFNFGFNYDSYSDSSTHTAAGPSLSGNDKIRIEIGSSSSSYENTTDQYYLLVHGKTATNNGSATDWKKITRENQTADALVQNYDSKNKYFLRGKASGNATEGHGRIIGTWQTW